jgi:hypothetical protein
MEKCKHEVVEGVASIRWGMMDLYVTCKSCKVQVYNFHKCQYDDHDCPTEEVHDRGWYDEVYVKCMHSEDNVNRHGCCGICGNYVLDKFPNVKIPKVTKSDVKSKPTKSFIQSNIKAASTTKAKPITKK